MSNQKLASWKIKAVRDELDRRINKLRSTWLEENPEPSEEAEREWLRKHKSPKTRHNEELRRITSPLEDYRDWLIFSGCVGKLSLDVLYEKVKTFRKDAGDFMEALT